MLSFFYFIFLITEQDFLLRADFFVTELGSSCKGFKFWGWKKNKKSIINAFVQNRNLKLLLHCLIFWGAWKCSVCTNKCSVVSEMGSTSKNNANTTECVGSSESKYVVFLICLHLLSDCFFGCWCFTFL